MASKIVRDSIDHFFDYDLHVETRTIYIGDGEEGNGVDAKMAEKLVKAFHLFNQTPDKQIRVILNSKGGDWYDGMAIYDAIKASPCHVVIEAIGCAMSMGSIILQAADERIVHPNSTVMIHDGSDFFDGHARNMERWGDWSKVLRKQMYAIYAEKSGKDSKYWEKRCGYDYILTAEQAVEEGLADKIIGEESEDV